MNYMKHDGELSTCAIAFFLLISFIPASLVIISILSLVYNSNDVAVFYTNHIKQQLPSININDYIHKIDNIIYSKRYLALIWLPFLFWWGSLVFDILETALGKAFHIKENRIYWKAKIRHFLIIVGIAFTVLLLTVISNLLVIIKHSNIVDYIEQNITNTMNLKSYLLTIGSIPLYFSSFITLFVNSLFIFIIYRFVPPQKLDNISLIKGALFASFSYEIVKTVFSFYITNINNYTSIFGSLSTIVILMIWIWYTCFIFIIGAEMAWIFYERKEGTRELLFDEE